MALRACLAELSILRRTLFSKMLTIQNAPKHLQIEMGIVFFERTKCFVKKGVVQKQWTNYERTKWIAERNKK